MNPVSWHWDTGAATAWQCVLWLLGDVLGVAFIVVLMRFFSADETSRAAIVDAQLDRTDRDEAQPVSGLWWENDPQLRERMRRA